jgi:orotidine-5'-phosphate decarboxylase
MSVSCTTKLANRVAKLGGGLCVGLDPRPTGSSIAPTRDFIRQVIEETLPYAAAYKPNSAYFECLGIDGWKLLEEIRQLVPDDVALIYDAKRSDIGETQKYYTKAAFNVLGADSITLNPFLGYDSIEPFLENSGKLLYLLAVTSNAGAADIELQSLANGAPVYSLVGEMAKRAAGSPAEVGFVVGLTNAASGVLEQLPDCPLLVPGLGAQGGEAAAMRGTGRQAPTVINVSRGILYAEPELSFAAKAEKWLNLIRG